MPPSPDPVFSHVIEAARILFPAGIVVELRVPGARRGTLSGYFDDPEKLAAAVAEIERTRVPGVYWTLNPVDRALLARASNRVTQAKNTTSDQNILRRVWLPIDCDPKRPAGISSTDHEHAAALALADHIRKALISEGWPEPILADSGNGAHLLYVIDLPNDEASAALIEHLLKALAHRFNTPEVEVDKTTFNASRIFKIYGTTARKGDHTEERPHRPSQILHVPALFVPVAPELLAAIAAQAPAKQKPPAKPASSSSSSRRRDAQPEFNLRRFLDEHGIRYRDPVPYDGGYKFTLESCPFDPSHQNKDAAVFERRDGYGFKCFHNSCSDRGWKEFRELFEPHAYSRRLAGRFGDAPKSASVPWPKEFLDEPPEEQVTEDDIKASVDEAIKLGNLDAVLMMVPEIARLSPLAILRVKSALGEKFGRRFRPGDFEKALRDEKRRGLAGLPPEDSSLPTIIVNNRPLRDVVAESLAALRGANDSSKPPFLFVRSGKMAWVERDERQLPSIQDVEKAHLRGRLDRAANYIRRGVETDIAVAPPVEVVEDILALPSAQWSLPPLESLVEVPTLRPDGTVLSSPGYDPVSRMLYMPPPGFKIDPIPDRVDADELDAAVAFVDESFCDFPFEDDRDETGAVVASSSSRANFYALLLTPIVRPAFNGSVPMALIDAPQAGTGKSLLVDLFSTIVTGRDASMMPFPRDEIEMQKSILATLLAGRALVCFDNVEGMLLSATLALALTAKIYEQRVLGISENAVAANRATWLATGNNIRPSGDMPRRCYVVRLDAKKSRPFQGRAFKHENLLEWARENRPQLLRSLLIIARAWYQRDIKTPPPELWGSFEGWHRTMYGILRCAGIEGFLGNQKTLLAEGDDMALQWESFLRELDDVYAGDWFTSGRVASAIRSPSGNVVTPLTLPDSLADVDRRKEGSLEKSLGKSFAKRIGMRFGESELHLVRRVQSHTKLYEWRVMTRETETAEANLAQKAKSEVTATKPE